MIKLYKNKKAGIEEGFTGFYSYTMIFFIFLIGFFLFSVNPKIVSETTIDAFTDDINVNTALRNLLNMPVSGTDWDVADLIILTAEGKCKDETETNCVLLKTAVTKSLAKFRQNSWQLTIVYPDESLYSFHGKLPKNFVSSKMSLPYSEDYIKVRLDASKESKKGWLGLL